MEGFLLYRFGGLVRGGAYFRNFTVFYQRRDISISKTVNNPRSSQISLLDPLIKCS